MGWDWNHPPAWFLWAITWGLFVVVLGIVALVVFVRSRPTFVSRGLRVYIDKGLTVRVEEFEELLDYFEDGMCPEPFDRKAYREQLTKMRVELRAGKLAAQRVENQQAAAEGREQPQYNGLTHSPYRIEVACDLEFQSPRGVVELHRTAFLYELLNALIWGLDSDGEYVAYAESGIQPTNEGHWRWLGDADGDQDVDAEDVFAWKARRAEYDVAFTARVLKYVAG